ncbi:Hypothetical predicted protein [Cloeon dipterum]|uniref:EGF-like domain-containing protein n=1 Tax=Cloeon dipterum TaxID=197152 RepID=A0A8S1CWN6_9INSE|nr:Hypothetical predicted protein [Cloeon dipterum]
MKLCICFIISSLAIITALPASNKEPFVCTKECRNGGECVGPDTCFCRYANFEGPQCDLPVNRCNTSGPSKNLKSVSCTPSRCTLECKSGYVFPPLGKSKISLFCRTDVWVQKGANTTSTYHPSCQPE